jgi:tetratricopeptide (TPR) repeat protein
MAAALGAAYSLGGRAADAVALLTQAMEQMTPEAEQAEAYYRQALVLANELGMRPLVAHCYLGLGLLYRRIGRGEEARAALSTAVERYHAMDMTFWLPQAEAALDYEAVGPR